MKSVELNRLRQPEANRGVSALLAPTTESNVAPASGPLVETVVASNPPFFEGTNATLCGNRSCAGFQRAKGRIVIVKSHQKDSGNQVQTRECIHCGSRWQTEPRVRKVL